ncbi:hypothetical protein [Candidatus Nitrosotenuis sp. DW1]|uniref:hypothetical protein n=1 Tax=Candidatus Nitrosotenuis sp. DW1 TaxID=2259672 RepID=UPI0015CA8AC7|nr:hypothetical protein [Candidatus Nitrosotenuis sp. DW1]QLH09697.1 hypothetical protein DSQ19_09680 [Candidatus Nitrosotenuis sp. DW1]
MATIFLVDSFSDLESLKNKNNQYQKVITFDFNSHKFLTDYNIPHEISDGYLTYQELRELQEKTLDLSTWSKQKEISRLIEYEGINLGNLVFNNFIDFIAGFLKKFCESQKIIQQHPNSEFICSSKMFEIVKIFSNNVKLEKKQVSTRQDEIVRYDFRLGRLPIQIDLTKEKYMKLKTITEFFISKIFNFDKVKNNENFVLLVEFDPIKYKNLLLSNISDSCNLLLYNRRRPAVWNFESFNIMRKSKCRIITSGRLVNIELQTQIDGSIQSIEKKLHNVWNERFFETFFSINGISFWKALKPFFEHNLLSVMKDSISEIELAKKLFERYDIRTILILSEIGPNEQILMHMTHQKGKHVVLMQHGIPYETKEASKRNDLSGFFPNFSDAMIVWGKPTKKYLEDSGIDPSKLKPLGNSPYDDLFAKKNPKNGDTILLATSPPMKDIVYDNLVETNEKYRHAIEKICKIVTALNQKLVIKLHPSLVDFDIESMAKKINDDILVVNSGSIFPLMENCKLLITFDLSTTILEAQILQKPVISVRLKDYGFGESEIIRSCIDTTIENLETNLNKLLTDNSYRQELIEKGNKFVDKYLENKGNATESIHKFLTEF